MAQALMSLRTSACAICWENIILHSRPEIEISFKFIPKILMSKECIHFFGPLCIYIYIFFFFQCHHMSFVEFVVLPPGHGRSVADFWGWDAHEAQLRCPDGVWVVIEEDVVPGGALNLNSTNLSSPWSPRESSPSRKIPTVEPGIEPGTSWLVVRDSDHKTTRLVSL